MIINNFIPYRIRCSSKKIQTILCSKGKTLRKHEVCKLLLHRKVLFEMNTFNSDHKEFSHTEWVIEKKNYPLKAISL